MNSRDSIRIKAKKAYKDQIKGVPKRTRIPFSDFYKRYKEVLAAHATQSEPQSDKSAPEDFDFESLVNLNEVSDDNLEVDEQQNEKVKE